MDCRKKDSSAKQAALRDLLTWYAVQPFASPLCNPPHLPLTREPPSPYISRVPYYHRKNPAASVFAIIAGSFIYAFLRNGSITTLVCYALLSRVGWHVVCTIFSKQAGANTRLTGSSFVENSSVTTARVVRLLAEVHDDYIVTADTRRSVTVSTALWSLSLVARRMDMLTLVYVAYLLAFLLPNVHDGHVTAILGELALRVKHSTPSVFTQMNTKQRRLSIAAIAASLWLVFDWPNRIVGLLMAVLCIRMTMTQVEVDNLREMGAPLTMSVKKKAARMSRRVSLYLGTADKTRLR